MFLQTLEPQLLYTHLHVIMLLALHRQLNDDGSSRLPSHRLPIIIRCTTFLSHVCGISDRPTAEAGWVLPSARTQTYWSLDLDKTSCNFTCLFPFISWLTSSRFLKNALISLRPCTTPVSPPTHRSSSTNPSPIMVHVPASISLSSPMRGGRGNGQMLVLHPASSIASGWKGSEVVDVELLYGRVISNLEAVLHGLSIRTTRWPLGGAVWDPKVRQSFVNGALISIATGRASLAGISCERDASDIRVPRCFHMLVPGPCRDRHLPQSGDRGFLQRC